MSSVDYNYQSSTTSSLVGKILEQGQRLRNSMVQTILHNDPFNKQVVSNNCLRDGDSRIRVTNEKIRHCCKLRNDLTKYPQVEDFSEERALQELGIISNNNLSKTSCLKSCGCDICTAYNEFVNRSEVLIGPNVDAESAPQRDVSHCKKNNTVKKKPDSVSMLKMMKNTFEENQNSLKYVDCLKVEIQCLRLNLAGRRKIESNNSEKFSFANSTTYFVEYSLPDILVRNVPKSRARVNSGLRAGSKVRYCSRRFEGEHIWFRNQRVHGVSNVELLDLAGINVELVVSCRSMRQRAPVFFARAHCNLGSLLASPLLGVQQELPVVGERAPVVLGHMSVMLQLGCDGLHFGKEFIDAIFCREPSAERPSPESVLKASESDHSTVVKHEHAALQTDGERPENACQQLLDTPALLYGFVQLPEARLPGTPVDSYLVCYGLHRDDTVGSQVVYASCNPVFNFYQLIPLLYDENFLGRLQDRHVVIEVWEKRRCEDRLIGITKLSLHRFFVIYRNPQVATHLFKNQSPVIGVDWWEPVIHPATGKRCGQLRALLAIGTETQVNSLKQNLEIKYLTSLQHTVDNIVYDKYVQTPELTVDASTQSELPNMESERVQVSATDVLNTFMEQVLAGREMAQKNVYVENSTNTEETSAVPDMERTDPAVKNTSDLLECLQKALGNDSDNKINLDSFKAHIVVDSALHLPSRRKCKSKRSKTRGAKHHEEILPSTYVSFKNEPGADMVVTGVVARSTSPHWDFAHDTRLPAELLLNNTKRLIFKVWRRSSATSLQPNFQTDVVLGFAALDLTVLLSGLPSVQGWFNIVDFSNKCNGQIKIHVTPLENLSRYSKYKHSYTPERPTLNRGPVPVRDVAAADPPDESPPELFNRALKRKFTELEEITQRLKQRLSTVTNDDSDMSDDFADEFERDLNTECVETEKITFENVLNNLNPTNDDIVNDVGVADVAQKTDKTEQASNLDQHLLEGKLRIDALLEKLSLITESQNSDQRIDSLLEKLTLITENDSDKSFSNRYVSGCSVDQQAASSPTSLEQLCAPDLDPDLIFNPLLFQQLFSGSSEPATLQSLMDSTSSSSSVDTLSQSSASRQAPDGAGISDAHLK